MNTFFRPLIASLAVGLVALVAMPVHAQSTEAEPLAERPAAWTQQFEEQMVTLLRAPNAERPERAMQLIIHYAQLDDANDESVFNLARTAPHLLDIYTQSEDVGTRLLALAALNAVDHEPTLKKLAQTLRGEQSDVVRHRAMHMLSARLQR
jgi:hypothetical protein